jgi:ABC-type multidrug transport system fused ATPase/permease subunit
MTTGSIATGAHRRRGSAAELAWLWRRARRRSRLLASALVLTIALALIDIPVPFVLMALFDGAFDEAASPRLFGRSLDRSTYLLALVGGLVALAFVKGGLVLGQRVVAASFGQRVAHGMRVELFRHLQTLSLGFFRKARTGRLMLRLMGDLNAIQSFLTQGALRGLLDGVTILGVAAALLVLDIRLGLFVLAGAPLYAFAFVLLSPRIRDAGKRARRERSRLSGVLAERIAGAAVVKAFSAEDRERRRVARRGRKLRARMIERARLGGTLQATAQITVALGGALVLGAGGLAVISGAISKGELIAFYTLAAMLFPPMRRLARANEIYQSARVSLGNILGFLDRSRAHVESAGGDPIEIDAGEIRFENVSLSYGENPALRGIHLTIGAGERVAIVGANGSGKSSLLALIPRFEDPERGRILVDGVDVATASLSSLRRQIAFVTQSAPLFAGTIADNLRYARPGASDDELERAARLAGLDEMLAALPKGLATRLGERGSGLSGGQAQRIALSRALLTEAPIVLLDEATSAVDPASETDIWMRLDEALEGRTLVVVAHRLATARRAERVVVLEHGRIVESGCPAELASRGEVFRALFGDELAAERFVNHGPGHEPSPRESEDGQR